MFPAEAFGRMQHIVVGTAGHIDHGKSSLVQALTGTDPDRMREEKARGITIDLGFAHTVEDGVALSFVDVPGHERFVRNMLAGVGGMDLVMLHVAADESVMPQTREAIDHVRAAGVPLVVAINKIDAGNANTERVKQQLMEVGLVPEEYGGEQVVVPVSALAGDGVAEELSHFAHCIRTGESPEAGGVEGLEIAAVLEAMQESVRSGRAVEMKDFRG